MLFVKVGVDIRLELAVDCLVNLRFCACCDFRLEAEVLVGGGVCIEPAKRIDVSESWSNLIFNGVDACLKLRGIPSAAWEDRGLGDEES